MIVLLLKDGSPALILYDYLLTFDAEVKYFWSTKVTGASVLFIANRYLNLVSEGWMSGVSVYLVGTVPKVKCHLTSEYVARNLI